MPVMPCTARLPPSGSHQTILVVGRAEIIPAKAKIQRKLGAIFQSSLKNALKLFWWISRCLPFLLVPGNRGTEYRSRFPVRSSESAKRRLRRGPRRCSVRESGSHPPVQEKFVVVMPVTAAVAGAPIVAVGNRVRPPASEWL